MVVSPATTVKVMTAERSRRELLRICLLALALVSLAGARSSAAGLQERETRCLSGAWQFQPQEGEFIRPEVGWSDLRILIPSPWNANAFATGGGGDFRLLPSYPVEWETAKQGWHRRTFSPSGAWLGRRIFVRFDAVNYYAEVYLNGVLAGRHEGGCTPFEVDITNLVRLGEENELVVGVRAPVLFDEGGRAPYPAGSYWDRQAWGIWQDAWLVSRPMVRIDDVFLTTFVRGRRARLQVRLVNQDMFAHDVFLKNEAFGPVAGQAFEKAGDVTPFDKAPRAKAFPLVSLRLQPYSAVTVIVADDWEGARLWSPDDPTLYLLKTVLTEAGRPIDAVSTRFGFREVRVEGAQLLLNDKPLKLRGDAWHFMGIPQQREEYPRLWYQMAREANLNHVRLHGQVFPSYYLDVADEMGMLVTDESAIWASGGDLLYNEDFFTRARQHIQEWVQRDRNHPSIIVWGIADGTLAAHDAAPGDGATSRQDLTEKIGALGTLVQNLDGSRPFASEGDEDLGGRAPLYSLHYPGAEAPKVRGKPLLVGEAGGLPDATPPEAARWNGERAYEDSLGRLEGLGMEVSNLVANYRRWATQVTLFGTVWHALEPLPLDRTLTYTSLEGPGVKPQRIGRYCTTLNAGWDDEMPPFRPTPLLEAIGKAMRPVRFFAEPAPTAYYAGSALTRQVYVHNDSQADTQLTLRWEGQVAGETFASGERTLALPPGEMTQVTVDFELPSLGPVAAGRSDEPGALDIRVAQVTVALLQGGAEVHREDWRWEVWPPVWNRLSLPTGSAVRVLAGDRAAADLLRTVGLEPAEVSAGAAEAARGTVTVVSGQGLTHTQAEALRTAARAGGAVLVLEQCERPEDLAAGVHRAAGPQDRAFTAPGEEHLAASLSVEDLWNWGPDGHVANATLEAELGWSAQPLATTGDGRPVALRVFEGEGQWMFSELCLLGKATTSPAAAALLRNLILEACASAPPARAAAVAPADSRLAAFLSALGLESKAPEQADVLVLDGGSAPPHPVPTQEQVGQVLSRGGTVLVCGLRPESADPWAKLLRLRDLAVEPLEYGQLVRAAEDDLLRGMHLDSLYWLERGERHAIVRHVLAQPERYGGQALLVTNKTDWSRWNWQPETTKAAALFRSERQEHPGGAALVRVRRDRGEILLCQIEALPFYQKSRQLYSLLLTNLGGRLRPEVASRPESLEAFSTDENGYVHSFLACGPFPAQSAEEALQRDWLEGEAEARPEEGMVVGGSVWRRVYARGQSLNLEEIFGATPPNRAAYVSCALCAPAGLSPEERRLRLASGSDNGMALWVNGKRVAYQETASPAHEQSVAADVELREGWNVVLAKASQAGGEWTVSLRVTKQDDTVPDWLRVRAQAPSALPEIDRHGWQATASHNAAGVPLAFDSAPATRWSSATLMQPGMWFQLDMGRVVEVARVLMDAGDFPEDYPRGYNLLASEDGEHWRVAGGDERASEHQAAGRLYVTLEPALRARYLKIVQTGRDDRHFWSISELKVFAPGPQEQ